MCRFPSQRPQWVVGRNFRAAVALGILCATQALHAEAQRADASFSVKIIGREDDTGATQPVADTELSQTMTAARKRLKALGYSRSKVEMTKSGTDTFQIEIKDHDADASADLVRALEKTGRLELKEVSPRSEETADDGRTLAQRVLDGDEIVPGYRAFRLVVRDHEGNEHQRPILLNRRTALGGADIARAWPSPNQEDAVAVSLNKAGTDKMVALTKNMRPGVDRIAVVLDGEVISAPVIAHTPLGKNFLISGLHQPNEARDLAHALMAPLEFPIIVKEMPRPPALDQTE